MHSTPTVFRLPVCACDYMQIRINTLGGYKSRDKSMFTYIVLNRYGYVFIGKIGGLMLVLPVAMRPIAGYKMHRMTGYLKLKDL